jgi:GTP pyrophosphokinase
VQPSWVNFVSTAKAKGKIQAILRRDGRELQKKDEALLEEFLQKNNIEMTPEVIGQLAVFHDVTRQEDFYQALGNKTILLGEKDLDELAGKNDGSNKGGWRKLVPFLKSKPAEGEKGQSDNGGDQFFVVPEKFNRKKPIYITDDNLTQYKFKHCCHPIPGDPVIGIRETDGTIYVHKKTCSVADSMASKFGDRVVVPDWADIAPDTAFPVRISIQGLDRMGLLNEISRYISLVMGVNMRKIYLGVEEGIFEGYIDLYVQDKDALEKMIRKLGSIDGIQNVIRTEI